MVDEERPDRASLHAPQGARGSRLDRFGLLGIDEAFKKLFVRAGILQRQQADGVGA